MVNGYCGPNAFGNADSPFLFEGPITRTVADAAIALGVLAGHDARDPFSLTEPSPDYTAATRRSIRGLRIAYSPDLDVFPIDRGVADVVGKAVRAFEEAGAHVEEVTLGITRPQRELSDVWSRLCMLLVSVYSSGAIGQSPRTSSVSSATRVSTPPDGCGTAAAGANAAGRSATVTRASRSGGH